MKNRDDMSAVIAGLQRNQGLLAAFLEATDKFDCRALHERAAIGEMPDPLNVEARQQASIAPKSPLSPFAFQRANLVRASE